MADDSCSTLTMGSLITFHIFTFSRERAPCRVHSILEARMEREHGSSFFLEELRIYYVLFLERSSSIAAIRGGRSS